MSAQKLTHLERLEAESIHIMREVVSETDRPVMLYSVGKDSAVMLHLAKKAFYPAVPPFPLLHVDTTWKFKDMYALRDRMAVESGMQLLVYQNPEAKAKGINPFDHGAMHTDMWKTEGLKQALEKFRFDAAFGGRPARRGEEPRQGARVQLQVGESSMGSEAPAAGAMERVQREEGEGREHSSLPAVELDRARYLAVHPPGEGADRAAVFRRTAPDRGAGRIAADGR